MLEEHGSKVARTPTEAARRARVMARVGEYIVIGFLGWKKREYVSCWFEEL